MYNAEHNANGGKGFKTLADVEQYVEKVLTSAWVRARFGNVRVRVERGYGGGGGRSFGGMIRIDTQADESVVLHEIAHELNRRGERASHGPEFAAIYLTLTQRFRGAEAARDLREQFVAHKVRHRAAKAIPAPTRPVESKTAVAARQRAKAAAPLTPTERQHAARLLRRAVASGEFGEPGRKPRAQAQALARTLERE